MRIKFDSRLGWTLHILAALLAGCGLGFMFIPGTLFAVFAVVTPLFVKLILSAACGAFYLYAFRNRIAVW